MTHTANEAYASTAGFLVQLVYETPGWVVQIRGESGPVGISGALPSSLGVWQEYSVTATAPAGAVYAIVYYVPGQRQATATENLYFDNAVLVPEPATVALLGMGLSLPLYLIRRRK